LRAAAAAGDYAKAKIFTGEIQKVLRPTGHETRLMQAKNWYFEAALAAGNIEEAAAGFIGVRGKNREAYACLLRSDCPPGVVPHSSGAPN
jgi:hypothetical protein